MKIYRIDTNVENFDIKKNNLRIINIDMVIIKHINIDMDICENIGIDMKFLEHINVDIGVLRNIDKIFYRSGFGISNTIILVGASRGN